jgi:hypothetical protein
MDRCAVRPTRFSRSTIRAARPPYRMFTGRGGRWYRRARGVPCIWTRSSSGEDDQRKLTGLLFRYKLPQWPRNDWGPLRAEAKRRAPKGANSRPSQYADPYPRVREGEDIVCAVGNDGDTCDVGSSHPGAGAGPKGRAVRPLKRYASWV